MNDKMTILVVEPGKAPYAKEIDDSLAEMQRLVGGSIEGTYPYDDPVAVICNGEGKLKGLPPNRPLTGPDGVPYDMIHGTFFVAGLGAEDFCSLTDEQVRRYQEVFRLLNRNHPKKPNKRENER